MSIQAIVFDFGNVIGYFDHRRSARNLAAHSHRAEDEIVAFLFGGQLEEDYEAGRISTTEFLQRVRDFCRPCCSDEMLAHGFSDLFWPNPEVCTLVEQLRPHSRLLLGSNTNELHSRHFRAHFADTLRHFDALVLSHEIGVRKPKPGFFQHCVQLAGCPAEQCLFIDDMPANVAGARACGWQAIQYRDYAGLHLQLKELGCDLPG